MLYYARRGCRCARQSLPLFCTNREVVPSPPSDRFYQRMQAKDKPFERGSETQHLAREASLVRISE